jgi:multiple sugar transport system substrate-binding protein
MRRIFGALLVLACLVPSLAAGSARAQRAHASVMLTFWTPLSGPLERSLLVPYFHQFEKSHPGITVKFVVVPGDNNFIKYTTAMAAGRGPDVVLTWSYNPPTPEWAANSFIQPLDPWFTQLHISQGKWLPWVWKMQYFHGRIWGLVQEYDTLLFVWNKDAFKKAGLDPNRPPRTIAELDAYAKKLTRFDSKGNLVQAGFVPWQNNQGSYEMRLWPTMFGGSIYDQAHGKYTFDTPANLRAFAWMGKYAKMLGGAEKVNGFLGKFTGNADPIYKGQVAMEVVGDWFPPVYYKPYAPNSFHYGVGAIPTAPGVPYGSNIVIGSDTYLLSAASKHPREAAQLMLYMMTSAPVLAWCIGEANVPPTREAAFSQRYVSDVPYMSVAVETARMALKDPRVLNPFPSSSIYDYVSTQETNAEQQIEYGRKSAKAALDDLQKLADQREVKAKQENPDWYRNGD